jgi:hypothetical protein
MSDDHSNIAPNKFGGKFSPLRVADVKLDVVPFRIT